jgi:molecular chaperone DnaJ
MATTGRDYYELLGVARSADEAELKRAFRRKARELHPDVSEQPDAEARFREVVEAYEVLSKSETRQLYDRFGHAGVRGGGFRPTQFDFGSLTDLFSAFFGDDVFGVTTRPRRSRGSDLAAEVEIELAEAAAGTTREVPFEVVTACARCGGNGAEPGTGTNACDTCGGTGRLQQVGRSVLGEFVRTQACPKCGGGGRLIEHPCEQCDGSGRMLERRTLTVDVPAGIADDQRIRLTGRGHAGERGGAPGDLYVLVRVKPDERFVRDGNDLVTVVDLPAPAAALGTTVTVPTLDGEQRIEIRPGTQPGTVVTLTGKGMPSIRRGRRGDQRVVVNVVIPRRLSERQRELLGQFAETLGEENLREPQEESLFAKVRRALR